MTRRARWEGEPASRVRYRNLPHWEVEGSCYFITFRLANSLPAPIAEAWREERRLLRELEAQGRIVPAELRARCWQLSEKFDRQLDRGETGPLHLSDPNVAQLVVSAMQFHDGQRYRLGPFVVMPNHVHLILRPLTSATGLPFGLDQILHGIKGFSAREANRHLGIIGSFWQREYYDHLIRDQDEWNQHAEYIHANPVKAGLCHTPDDWPWGNATSLSEPQ